MNRVKPVPAPPSPVVSDSEGFGASIRAARRAAGMSLTDAAMVLGVARQTLINLETAKAGVGLDTALRAAREFGLGVVVVPPGRREAVLRLLDDAER